MIWPAILLTVYSVLIVAASSLGGWLPGHLRLSHTRMQMIMSFVAGLMLGVALLHMVPHATAELGSLDQVVTATLVGLLAMFFLMRTFHFHHHDSEELSDAPAVLSAESLGQQTTAAHTAAPHEGCPADHKHHDHKHDHDHAHSHAHTFSAKNRYSWMGLFLGLAVHTLIDGVALGASVAAEAEHGTAGLLGLGTFLAVLLHKPLDAMSISSLMIASGWSASRRKLVNLLFASMCPLGALLFWFGVSRMLQQSGNVLGLALAFSAGVFLCISLSDLLPEVHFHSHDRLPLSVALIAGVALAYAVGFLEPHDAHHHEHHHGPGNVQIESSTHATK